MKNPKAAIRELAKNHKLGRVNFLDKFGKPETRDGKIFEVEMQFSNGQFVKFAYRIFLELDKEGLKYNLMNDEEWKASGIEADSAGKLQ